MSTAKYDWAKTWEFKDSLNHISAADASHVWATGEDIFFFNGSTWEEQAPIGGIGAICAVDASHVWAAGDNAIYFFDGADWNTQFEAVGDMNDVYAVDPGHAWAVCAGRGEKGEDSALFAFDGREWKVSREFADESLSLVFALDKEHIWAVGYEQVHFYDGGEWGTQEVRERKATMITPREGKQKESFMGFSACDEKHAWMVGEKGGIYVLDGPNWKKQLETRVLFGRDSALYDVLAVDRSHVWAVGNGGVLFYDGKDWSLQYGLTMDIQGVCARSADVIWAAGQGIGVEMEGATYEGRKVAE